MLDVLSHQWGGEKKDNFKGRWGDKTGMQKVKKERR